MEIDVCEEISTTSEEDEQNHLTDKTMKDGGISEHEDTDKPLLVDGQPPTSAEVDLGPKRHVSDTNTLNADEQQKLRDHKDGYLSTPGISCSEYSSFQSLDLKPDTNPYPVKRHKRKMSRKDQFFKMKSLLLVSVGFMLMFSSFNGMQNLASSLFKDEGLGVMAFSCYYAFGIFSCFITPFVVKKLTPKYSVVISIALTSLYIGSMLYPKPYTMIPSSIILGIANGPYWTAAALYVTTNGFEIASQAGKLADPVVSRFHGIWIAFQQSSQVFGNLLSSVVLQTVEKSKPGSEEGIICGASQCKAMPESVGLLGTNSFHEGNAVINSTFLALNTTRALFHSVITSSPYILDNSLSTAETSGTQNVSSTMHIYILGGIFIALPLVGAILLAIFLDPLRLKDAPLDCGSAISVTSILSESVTMKKLLLSTLKCVKETDLLLLIPLSYLSGMQLGYLFAEFTQAFVSCAVGVDWVGYMMICYGATDVIFCYLAGKLCKILGRLVLFSTAFIVHSGIFITMLTWYPTTTSLAPFFVIPGLWGLCDAVWQPQTIAFISLLYPKNQEPALSFFRLFHNLGYAVTFGYSFYLCMYVKLYIAQTILTLAFVCYVVVELRLRQVLCCRSKKEHMRGEVVL